MSSDLFKNLKNIPTPTTISIGIGTKIGLEPHFHSSAELVYLLDGSFSMATPTLIHKLSAGDIILTSANTPHASIDPSPRVRYIVCYLKFANAFKETKATQHLHSYLSSQQHISYVFKADTTQNQFIGNTMENILKENSEKKPYYTQMIEASISQINSFLLRENIISESLSSINMDALNKIMPVIEYINQNYNIPINANDLSSEIFTSYSHFAKLFKLATSTTFTDYLNYVRIQNAQQLIKDTNKSIGEIAREVGFSSQIYFCRCFKKYNMCTPMEYKHQKLYF